MPEVGDNSSRSTDTGYSLQITLFNDSLSTSISTISSTNPGRVVALLTRYGDAQSGQIINFSSTLGAFVPALATALTNSDGEASIRLVPAGVEGAGTLRASTYIDELGSNLVVDLNFSIVDAAEEVTISSINIDLEFIGFDSTMNSIRGDAPGSVTALITDENGTPLDNTLVSFTENNLILSPVSGQVLTNSSGEASVQVMADNVIGVGNIVATVIDGEAEYSETLNIAIDSPEVKLGSFNASSFINEQLDVSVDVLSAGGSATITANVVDASNNPFTDALAVNFTSTCVAAGTASIDSTVLTNNGEATAVYRANGCIGNDTITATLNFAGAVFTASAELSVSSDAVGSIAFVGASPETIVIRGTGGAGLVESSLVSFQVLGVLGAPVANEEVSFELTSDLGGINLTPQTAISDADGMVFTTVNSGQVAASVIVIATSTSLGISTQSSSLAVSTGVPEQDNTSISFSLHNPEAFEADGETIDVTVRTADQFNNLVPDGVQFLFTAESGGIDPSCTISSGSCSVLWTSQGVRPADGRVRIMVHAIGAESFFDENGNGFFDDGDILSGDLTEAFRDDNDDGIRNQGEPYVDFNGNGVFDLEDGLYGGPSCEDSSRCATQAGVSVRDSDVIVVSGSEPVVQTSPDLSSPLASGSGVTVTITDARNNSMPGGTQVEVSLEVGEITGVTNYEIPTNTINASVFTFFVSRADGEAGDVITVKTITPKGIERSTFFPFSYAP